MTITFLNILLLGLAAWRLSSLIANEDGPWKIFKRIRDWAERSCEKYWWCREFGLYDFFSCEWCNSVWICSGITLAWFFAGNLLVVLLLPFTFSTIVIFLKFVIQGLEKLNILLEPRKE